MRNLHRWLLPYLLQCRQAVRGDKVHLLLCIADHFEPRHGNVSAEEAHERVAYWEQEYPRQLGHFRDSDGRPPRHTFFYPMEQYNAKEIDGLAGLCQKGFGEVEVHLHHDGDTAQRLSESLQGYKELLVKHELLAHHRESGAVTYGFVHGNWALGNSRPDGRWCGVDEELSVLHDTGCYADFTFPSAPDITQPKYINTIYRARSQPFAPVGDGLMLIQGPLLLDWRRRKWGMLPRIENGCLQATQPPCPERLRLWLKARIQVAQRPDWFFVKLYTHGATPANRAVLLGDAMVSLHKELAQCAGDNFHFHYVTAREMYNLVRAAESGWQGEVDEARDWEMHWNGKIQS